ncbi:hypothetical protein JCM11251_003451 [Rhodosporidiobolus azoricus]
MLDPDNASGAYVDSPLSAYDLTTLDADGVHRLFTDLGFPYYHEQLQEHGITGEVLVHLDHAALKDVGVHSVGQRLTILKTVYDLKVLQNIPVEEGHYVPPSEEWDLERQMAPQQVIGLLTERDDRIRNLEHEVHNLHTALVNLREETLTLARSTGGMPAKPRPNVRSPTSAGFPHPLSNASTLSRSSSTPSRPRNLPPVAAVAAQNLALPSALPDSPASPIIDSPRLVVEDYQQQQQQTQHVLHEGSGHHVGATKLQPGEFSINGVATPTTPTAPMLIHPDSHAAAAAGQAHTPLLPVSANSFTTTSGSYSLLAPSSSRPSTASTEATSPSTAHTPSTSRSREGSSSAQGGSSADNPYRSFRVTLEDPCYKVLPAALKKYKINDDWRLYALFICYGNTERCLAYDEKPLLLFQKLKESNDNPVFMLRHIKDIKSPIAVASAKHAARRDKRPPGIGGGVERSLMGATRDGSSASGTGAQAGASGLAPNARPTRLHHPPVLLPVGKDKEKKEGGEEGGAGEGEKEKVEEKKSGYCIAIYPYLAEREDEFDVAVGDTFVILSKTKGWWVVHRDQSTSFSTSHSHDKDGYSPAARRSAWVPAGCLLETSVPPLSLLGNLSSTTGDSSSKALSSSTGSSSGAGKSSGASSAGVPAHEGNAASVPILPSFVVSVSTPGICLMDYSPRGIGELEVKKGQPLRILKRYNHWSYAIKDDGGRGWVPSWFCGRANKGDGTPTTPTISASGHAGGNSSSNAPSSTPNSAPSSTFLSAPSSGLSISTLSPSSFSTSNGAGSSPSGISPLSNSSGSGSNSTASPAGDFPSALSSSTTTTSSTKPSSTRPNTAPSGGREGTPKPLLSVAVTGGGGGGGGSKSAGPAMETGEGGQGDNGIE